MKKNPFISHTPLIRDKWIVWGGYKFHVPSRLNRLIMKIMIRRAMKKGL